MSYATRPPTDENNVTTATASSSRSIWHKRRFLNAENLSDFFAKLGRSAEPTVSFPQVPAHPELPSCERIELTPKSYFSTNSPTLIRCSTALDEIICANRIYSATKHSVDAHDTDYLTLFQSLYSETKRQIQLSLKCGNFLTTKRPRPRELPVTVEVSDYDQIVAEKMNKNRREREKAISRLLLLVNEFSVKSARLEYLCSYLYNLAASEKSQTNYQKEQLQEIGLKLFYRICTSVQGVERLFSSATDCYGACIDRLGSAFVFNNPTEQLNLMRENLAGNPLSFVLVKTFTPHCMQPTELLQLYSELSASIRMATTATAVSDSTLTLLRCLDIEHAGRQLHWSRSHSLGIQPRRDELEMLEISTHQRMTSGNRALEWTTDRTRTDVQRKMSSK
jgi:hypothetical protein